MPVVVLFLIFVALLVIAVPVSITLGITSVLPSVFDPSFTVGAKYLIRAMFGGLDSFPLLAVPMFVLSGIIMAKGGISKKLFDVFAYFLGKFTAGMPCAVIVTFLHSDCGSCRRPWRYHSPEYSVHHVRYGFRRFGQ